jgi:hypothetical protein
MRTTFPSQTKNFVSLLFLLSALSGRMQAQTAIAVPTYNTAKVDTLHWTSSIAIMPLSILGAGLELAYEHHLPGTFSSLRFNAGGFLATNPWFYDNEDGVGYENYSGFRAEIQYRIHLIKKEFAMDGFYLGPYAQYKYIYLERPYQNIQTSDKFVRATGAYGAGVIFGYQERFASRLMIDFYAGAGLIIPTDQAGANVADISIINPYKRGITLHGGVGIGLLPRKPGTKR